MKLNEIAEPAKKGIIYVDMDGVLADFVTGVDKILPNGYSEERNRSDPRYRKEIWKVIAEYSQKGNKIWRELPLMPDALKLWEYVSKYNPQILSASGNPAYGAEQQKIDWVGAEIPDKPKINLVRQSAMKAKFVKNEGDILIDDQRKSIDPWIAAGGIGILHKSADRTISELKKLGY